MPIDEFNARVIETWALAIEAKGGDVDKYRLSIAGC